MIIGKPMPVRKKGNKKNLPQAARDRASVPHKEESSKKRVVVTKTGREDLRRINAGAVSGKKKRPKT